MLIRLVFDHTFAAIASKARLGTIGVELEEGKSPLTLKEDELRS